MKSWKMASVVWATALFMNTSMAFAGDMIVKDAFALVSSKMAKAGAAFVSIKNETGTDDRLVAVRSDIAKRVELHTHQMTGNVMKMVHIKEGFELPAGEMLHMERGGNHIMMMGLNTPLQEGDSVHMTLVFEHSGEVMVMAPVGSMKTNSEHSH